MERPSEAKNLRRSLGPVLLWGLGVGYVISGEYFGWNLGLPLGGTYGMLAATALVTLLYVAFVFGYTELACALPKAGGVFVYAERAFGRRVGFVAGLAQIIEFVFAPPAIAMAIGAYVTQRYTSVDPRFVAVLAYALFTLVNLWGVKQAAAFELLVTILAVGELLLFLAVSAPTFSFEAFSADAWPNGFAGMFACLPFAVWFYLGIEGVANAAEEAKHPERDIARGFGAAIATLVTLAVLVFVFAVGVAGWRAVVYAPGSDVASDAPLPLALAHVVGRDSSLYTLLLGVGLLGLVASFHGILLAASRALWAFGGAGYAPRLLGTVWTRTDTPAVALMVNFALGVLAIASGKTADIITVSCFGALTLYVIALLTLFVLRKREPSLARPYRALGYPLLPGLGLLLALFVLAAMTVSNPMIALGFFAALGLGLLVALAFRVS